MTHLVVRGRGGGGGGVRGGGCGGVGVGRAVWGSQFFSLESHPTNRGKYISKFGKSNIVWIFGRSDKGDIWCWSEKETFLFLVCILAHLSL